MCFSSSFPDLSPFSNTASWGDTLGIDCEQVSASVMDSLLKGAEGCLDDLLKMFDMSSQTYDEVRKRAYSTEEMDDGIM